MKLDKRWRTLGRDEKRAWSAWAKDNPVLLDHGVVRRVSGHKAFTVILNNRAIAGEAANPTVVPAAENWLVNALTVEDAGPFTTNNGYVGFRVVQNLATETQWFVWATPPQDGNGPNPHGRLRFIKFMTVGALDADAIVPDIGPDYLAVCGSWDGPGEEGACPVDMFVWFRLHQYANGQLGPGVMMKGRIQVEL
jgi:hypothetical protein